MRRYAPVRTFSCDPSEATTRLFSPHALSYLARYFNGREPVLSEAEGMPLPQVRVLRLTSLVSLLERSEACPRKGIPDLSFYIRLV